MRSRSFLGALALSTLFALPVAGCLERPVRATDPRSTAEVVQPLKMTAVERIDLLFAIDNSASMGDKQEILARAVPDLVKRLANPRCVDAKQVPVADQPKSPTANCPPGSEREFIAVPDIHVGIVSSSLGGPEKGACHDDPKRNNNDQGRLLSRTPDGKAGTYGDLGFLAWDPDQKLSPPGESVLEDGSQGLVPTLQEMVRGVGEKGCGYESQLESWYRFLIQPDPYKTLTPKGDDLVPTGVDGTLLSQRKAFLRPDSLVAIIMLSDENDCSIAPGDGALRVFSAAQMVKPRAVCEDSPDDPCCAPCDEIPDGCSEDPSCKDANGNVARLSAADDPDDLRCFDQKRRFGKSYLYPADRYVNGLSQLTVQGYNGETVPNPLFSDLDPDDDLKATRNPSLVFLAGIVGVPWQDIARDPSSLAAGLKSAAELQARNEDGLTTWDVILGDPAKGTLPKDPHMRESQKPRDGMNPITGTSLAGPGAGFGADPISGHEQPELAEGLQYACTFPLLSPIVCDGTSFSCDCNTPGQNPLCQSPDGSYSSTQVAGKAFPALRELSVLKGLDKQAIVASVCPAKMDEAASDGAPDFGYRPAIGALIDRLKEKLEHQCLPRQLTPDADGQVGCLVIEARKTDSCSCKSEDGRAPVEGVHAPAIEGAIEQGVIDGEASCFCEIPQLQAKQLEACQTEQADPIVVDEQQVNGWCYIDASAVPPIGSGDLVPKSCAATEKRLVRFVGTGKARPGSELFIMCTDG